MKITHVLLIALTVILVGCRTVKKEWVKQNYASKTELNSVSTNILNKIESSTESLKTTLNASFEEKIQETTQKTTTEESEQVTVSGTIEAENGKEKSVKVGNTTITSNGANISFKTESTNSFTSEYESKLKEVYSLIEQNEQELIEKDIQLQQVNKSVYELQKELEEVKNTKTKEVKKTGFSFWAILIGIIALLLYILYRRYKGYLFN